ncbi:Yip1 family protein [Acholeplasma hippikon]|uniref:Uncharacterized protein conserved in archaea n=1 Tax=Acholeplasma hippikon TaxID=264636 RepID=A0A449BID4_9MOLU|nr:Yip1 family protein [Acholeplasma hippikon]VEU82198.1 Uncharacterized protein conserved in archaea [Acholeplasma hippikon]
MFKKILNKIKNFDYLQFLKHVWEDYFKFPIYILTHPFQGFDDFKLEKKGKYHVAITYILLLVISTALQVTRSGFLIRESYVENFSIIKTFFLITVPIALIAIGNWSITSLFEGKGTLGEIFKVLGYAVIPLVWFGIPLTFISGQLIQEELAIYATLSTIGVVLTGYMGFFGLLVIHEYGLAKTIVTLIATILAVAVIIFVGILILTLFQQIWGFIQQVYEEFIMRNS